MTWRYPSERDLIPNLPWSPFLMLPPMVGTTFLILSSPYNFTKIHWFFIFSLVLDGKLKNEVMKPTCWPCCSSCLRKKNDVLAREVLQKSTFTHISNKILFFLCFPCSMGINFLLFFPFPSRTCAKKCSGRWLDGILLAHHFCNHVFFLWIMACMKYKESHCFIHES